MWPEVVLVEEFGAFSGIRDQPLRLANVPYYNVTYVCVELLSRQLQTLVSLQLLLPQLGHPIDLLPAKLHELLFAFCISLFLCRFSAFSESLVTDHA